MRGTEVREGFLEEVVLGPNGEERPEQQEQRPCGETAWLVRAIGASGVAGETR